MSLGKTLLKVAIGIVIAKGVSSMTKGGSAAPEVPAGRTSDRSAGRGTPYDGQEAGRSSGQAPGLEDLLKDVMGSGGRARSGSARQSDTRQADNEGGLGDLLDQISGQKRSSPRATAPKGGLEDLLGQLTGGRAATETSRADRGEPTGGVGDLLDQVLNGKKSGGPLTLPEPQQEEELSAALMLRAVIQAVKCDGDLDEDEKARLMKAMGEADAREVQAVNAELQRPVDVKGLARAVPAGLEPQVYVVSLMAINLDQKAEAEYRAAIPLLDADADGPSAEEARRLLRQLR